MNTDHETWVLIMVMCPIALILWAWIMQRGSRSSLMGVLSPISLFALGMIVFYTAPCMYWQFFEWSYPYPGYFEGLPRLLLCSIVFSVPFVIIRYLTERTHIQVQPQRIQQSPLLSYRSASLSPRLSYLCTTIVAIGMVWRCYLITKGHQGVMIREEVNFLGSPAAAELLSNIAYASPIFYIILIINGKISVQRHGKIFWAIDAVVTLLAFNRTLILLFALQSAILARLIGWTLTPRRAATLLLTCLVLLGLIGRTKNIAVQIAIENNTTYLTPSMLVEVLTRTVLDLGAGETERSGTKNTGASGVADDIANRLYEARSASAVMKSVPSVIPYKYGSTFAHILYAFIPRAIWADKPSLREIHLITELAMPNDYGINPLGTLGEFYVNFGIIGVFLGGCVCAAILQWAQNGFTSTTVWGLAWLYSYPLLARWILGVNFNFSQNMAEMMRGFLIVVPVAIILSSIIKTRQPLNNGRPMGSQ